MKHFLSKRALSVAFAAMVVLAVAGVASASVPSGDGSIHACVARNGAVRIIDPEPAARPPQDTPRPGRPAGCGKNESPLRWNQQGPPAAPSAVVSGVCSNQVPKTIGANARFAVTCTHQVPFSPRAVVVTPAFSDAYAEATYVLRPGVDYSYQLDLDSGSDSEFVIIVQMLRAVVAPFPTPDVDYHGLLFSYLGNGVGQA